MDELNQYVSNIAKKDTGLLSLEEIDIINHLTTIGILESQRFCCYRFCTIYMNSLNDMKKLFYYYEKKSIHF